MCMMVTLGSMTTGDRLRQREQIGVIAKGFLTKGESMIMFHSGRRTRNLIIAQDPPLCCLFKLQLNLDLHRPIVSLILLSRPLVVIISSAYPPALMTEGSFSREHSSESPRVAILITHEGRRRPLNYTNTQILVDCTQ